MLDSSDVRKINLNLIRTELWHGGEHTKQSVARNTGLSVATCNTLLNELEANGEVISEKRQLNGVGRSTSVFHINESYESILCIRFDMMSDESRVIYCDVLSMLGSRIYQCEKHYNKLGAQQIAEEIAEMLKEHTNVSCVLIGTNGVVDDGIIRMTDIPELDRADLRTALQDIVQDLPVFMTYDGQFRAYGAYKKEGYTTETVTAFHCIKNVIPGAASVVGGKILNGKNGFAGMTGYMPCDMDREEQIRVIAEDERAGANIIAMSVISLVVILNPDEIIFSGNVVGEQMLDQIREICLQHLPSEFLPRFRIAEAGGDPYYLEGMYQKALEMKVDLSISK